MPQQHIENLFRRFKSELVKVKTVSGSTYEGKVTEITNDYVCLLRAENGEDSNVYLFFTAVESVTSGAESSS